VLRGALHIMNRIILISSLFLVSCTPNNLQKITVSDTAQSALLQTQQIQLSPPNMQVDSLLFKKSARVSLDFAMPETDIYYILNGENSQKYDAPFDIQKTTNVSVQARKNGFQNSDWIETTIIQINNKTQNADIELTPEAHKNYPATGAGSLIDLRKGTLNFRAGQFWSGFQSEEVVVWIFLPKQIEVWNEDKLLGTIDLNEPKSAEKSALKSIAVDITPNEYKNLKIKILNHINIPDWHAGKGTPPWLPPWLFMDEIFVE